jgi:hypothetical protein
VATGYCLAVESTLLRYVAIHKPHAGRFHHTPELSRE